MHNVHTQHIYTQHTHTQAERIAAEKEKEQLAFEALKLKQRKNAMSVMAHYTLDENNQRVERECMFREEHHMRRFLQGALQLKEDTLKLDRNLMIKEDLVEQHRRGRYVYMCMCMYVRMCVSPRITLFSSPTD